VEAPRWPSEAPNWEAKAMSKLLDSYNVNVGLRDREGRSHLLMVAKNGCKELVELLLAHNGVVTADSIDQNRRVPLYWAVIGKHITIVKLLLATRKVDINHVGWSYCTPLSVAAGGGRGGIVKLLLVGNGIGVNRKDLLGRTPLSLAAEEGHQAVVKLLLDHGVIVDEGDVWGHLPLSYVLKNGHRAICQLLMYSSYLALDQ